MSLFVFILLHLNIVEKLFLNAFKKKVVMPLPELVSKLVNAMKINKRQIFVTN